jgi:gas vesicle protein
MSEHTMNYGGGLLLAFLGGAAIGAGVALLTAPKSGRETRQIVRESMTRNKEHMAALPPAVHTAYTAAAEAGKKAFDEAWSASDFNGGAQKSVEA